MKSELNKKLRRNRIKNRLSIAFTITAVVVITVLFYFWMYKYGLFVPPRFITDLIEKSSDETEVPTNIDEERYYSALESSLPEKDIVELKLSEQDIFNLLSETEPIDKYIYYAVISYYDSRENIVSFSCQVIRYGEKYRADIYSADGVLKKQIICDGEKVSVTEFVGTERYTESYTASDGFDMEHQVSIISVYDLREVLFGDNSLNAENIKVYLLRSQSETMYKIEYDYPHVGQHESANISLLEGMITSYESRDIESGRLLYSFDISSLTYDISADYAEQLFMPESN